MHVLYLVYADILRIMDAENERAVTDDAWYGS